MKIPLGKITPDPKQPRKTFEEEAIKELANSFNSYGIISPLKVRPSGDNQFMIITGEMRYRAAKQRGDKEIEVGDPIEATDQQAAEMQLIENLQRWDISPLELGEFLYNHRKKYELTQQQLASILGKSREGLAKYESLRTLVIITKNYLQDGKLDYTRASLIGTVDEKRQGEFADIVVSKSLSQAKVQEIAPKINAEPDRSVADIVDDVISGKAKEDEATRAEAAKRAAGVTLETPEELMRGSEALKKEAQRKAKESMTPEKKAEVEAKKKTEAEAKRVKDEERKRKKAEENQKREERVGKKLRKQLKGDKIFVKESLKAMPEQERVEMLDMVPIPDKSKKVKSVKQEFDEIMKAANNLADKLDKLKKGDKLDKVNLQEFSITLRILADYFDEFAKLAERRSL